MPWIDGMPAEDLGYVQNKGWDKLPDADAAKTLLKTYRELETYRGAPADRLVVLPAEDTPDAWKPVWEKLGVPKDASGYEVPDDLKPIAHTAGLTPKQAKALAEQLTAREAAAKTAAEAEATAKAGREAADKVQAETVARSTNEAALKGKWGGEFDTRRLAADAMAGRLGYTAAELQDLAATPKYGAVMERLYAMAAAGGELRMVDPGAGGNGGNLPRTMEQVQARKDEIMKEVRGKMLTGEQGEKYMKELADLAREEVALRHRR